MGEKFKKNLPLVAVLLGIFAVSMIFCSAICFVQEDMGIRIAFNGLDVAFGKEYEAYEESMEWFEFSFGAFLAYALPLLGVICVYVADSKKNNKCSLLAFACFVAGAILLFLMKNLYVMPSDMEEMMDMEEMGEYIKLGSGVIIGAISCIVAALCLWPDVNQALQSAPVQNQAVTEPVQNEEVAE